MEGGKYGANKSSLKDEFIFNDLNTFLFKNKMSINISTRSNTWLSYSQVSLSDTFTEFLKIFNTTKIKTFWSKKSSTVSTPSSALKNSNKVLRQGFKNNVNELLEKINVTSGEISSQVHGNIKKSWKKCLRNQFKTLLHGKNHELSLKHVKKHSYLFYVKNKSRYILYIYYILLNNNNNNNKKTYSDGEKDFISQLHQEKKTLPLKNHRRFYINSTILVSGGV